MAARFPRTSEEFHSITGIGEHKLRKYGAIFLEEIENYCIDYGLVPYALVTGEKSEKSEVTYKDTEKERVVSREITQNNEDSEAEIEMSGTEMSRTKISGTESNNINSLEAGNLSKKRARYLNMSIQDWSERNSLAAGSEEMDSEGISPESRALDDIKADPFESDSFEMDSLQRTYSLFSRGIGIDEIAEIHGVSTRTVFGQLEQLALSGNVKSVGGLLPPERQKQIKAALETLEIELDSLIRAKLGENCQEEEIKFIRALLLSRICFSRTEGSE